MSLSNSFHMEGEVKKVENVVCEDGTRAYKFVLKAPYEDDEGKEHLGTFDLFALGSDEYDPWADLVNGRNLHVAVDGEVHQDEGGKLMLLGIAVRHIPQPTVCEEDADGDGQNDTFVRRYKSKEYRILEGIFGEA